MTTRALVLVVDDETRIRRYLSEQLEKNGFDVCQAQDGEQALEVFRLSTIVPDIVLLDLMMPVMDGHETLKALREISAVPVIMLTARDYLADKKLSFEGGADDYVVKPFSIDELLLRIHALLRRTQRAGELTEETVIQNGPLKLFPRESTAFWNEERLSLTRLEYVLLEALCRKAGRILPYERLLTLGWPQDTSADVSHLRVAMARLRKKLAAAGADPQILSSYTNVGYMLGELTEYDIDYNH